MSPELSGALMVIVSAACFSAKAVFAKLAYRQGADPSTVLSLRMAFSLPFFALAALRSRRGRPQRLSSRDLLQLVLLGSGGYYLAALFDFLGLAYVSASAERLILFLYPTLVVAMGLLLRGERLSRRIGLAMGISYLGVALVVWRDGMSGGTRVWLGSAFVFAGAVAYACYLFFSQPLLTRLGSGLVTSHILLVACLCVLAQFALENDWTRLHQPASVYWLGAATGLIATVVPAFLLAAGVRRLGASRASLLGTVGPVVTLGLANLMLGEPITMLSLVGSSLVLIGVWLVIQERTPVVHSAGAGSAG
jgi:drug/metabolite transporter (DMT)-like permease